MVGRHENAFIEYKNKFYLAQKQDQGKSFLSVENGAIYCNSLGSKEPANPWRTGLIYDETRTEKRWISPSLADWNIKKENTSHTRIEITLTFFIP